MNENEVILCACPQLWWREGSLVVVGGKTPPTQRINTNFSNHWFLVCSYARDLTRLELLAR